MVPPQVLLQILNVQVTLEPAHLPLVPRLLSALLGPLSRLAPRIIPPLLLPSLDAHGMKMLHLRPLPNVPERKFRLSPTGYAPLMDRLLRPQTGMRLDAHVKATALTTAPLMLTTLP